MKAVSDIIENTVDLSFAASITEIQEECSIALNSGHMCEKFRFLVKIWRQRVPCRSVSPTFDVRTIPIGPKFETHILIGRTV